MFNQIVLIGRLGKDPDLSYTQSGTARCRLSLATSESYTDNSGQRQEKTEWHNIVVWGKQAESAGNHLSKGRMVAIVGKSETRSWDDQQTGEKKYMTEVKAHRVVFLPDGQNRSQGQAGGRRGGGGGQGGSRGRPQENDDQGPNGGPPPDDDDIPF